MFYNTDYRIACMMPVIVNINFDIKFGFIPSSSEYLYKYSEGGGGLSHPVLSIKVSLVPLTPFHVSLVS